MTNKKMLDDLAEVLLEQCQEGEVVIMRRSRRWILLTPGEERDVYKGWEGEEIKNSDAFTKAEHARSDLDVVLDFNHLAIMRPVKS